MSLEFEMFWDQEQFFENTARRKSRAIYTIDAFLFTY